MAEVIVRGSDCFRVERGWMRGLHSLDPRTPERFGPLVVHTDDWIAGGSIFPPHDHAAVEIVTFVLEGRFRFSSSVGDAGELRAGGVQVLATGSGITHAEGNASPAEPLRVMQMWLRPKVAAGPPACRQINAEGAFSEGTFRALAASQSDRPDVVPLVTEGARFGVVGLAPGETAELPAADLAHLYVVDGDVEAGETRLLAGDSLRATGQESFTLASAKGVRLAVWLFEADADVQRNNG